MRGKISDAILAYQVDRLKATGVACPANTARSVLVRIHHTRSGRNGAREVIWTHKRGMAASVMSGARPVYFSFSLPYR